MPTGIPYCDKVLEVTGGCTKCAPGCQNCWAIKNVWRMAHRTGLKKKWKGLVEKKNGVLNWTGRIKCFEDVLEIPLRRKKPTTYFVNSKADLFHSEVPFSYIDEFMQIITMYPQQHTFLIFTKRIERAAEYFQQLYAGLTEFHKGKKFQWPFRNVQLILSISTQKEADKIIPILLQIPATVRGLSIEPMLENIKIKTEYLTGEEYLCDVPETEVSWETGRKIDGIVVGCESGPKRRPCKMEWVYGIINQCEAIGIPCFVKQINLHGKVVKMPKGFPQQLPERS